MLHFLLELLARCAEGNTFSVGVRFLTDLSFVYELDTEFFSVGVINSWLACTSFSLLYSGEASISLFCSSSESDSGGG